MFVINGILCLFFLCVSILFLASFPIYQYKKNKTNEKTKDYYSLLFEVFEENIPYKSKSQN
jgi:hypothetical protein